MKTGISRAGLLHHLNYLTGKRTDVSPAVTTDLGFIANAAERHADEFAAGRLGDRHAERRLTDAGRSDEAENGTLRDSSPACERPGIQECVP